MESATATYPRCNISKPARVITQPCHRCGGTGVVLPYGTCFRCAGGRIDPQREWGYPASWTDEECAAFNANREARNQKAREARQAKAVAEWKAQQPSAEEFAAREEQARLEREAIWDANIAQLPMLAQIHDHPNRETLFADFLLDICDQAHYRPLTDRQRVTFERVATKQLKRHKIAPR